MKACLILAALAGSALADVFPGVHYTNGWVMSKEYIPASTAVTFTVVVKEQGIDEVSVSSACVFFLLQHARTSRVLKTGRLCERVEVGVGWERG
jgi:hypothetical protein